MMENYDAINDMERDFPADERISVKVFVPKEEQVQGIKKYLCTLFPHIKEEGLVLECRPRKHGNRIYFVRYYDVLVETFIMDETQTEYDAGISFEHKLQISHSALVLNQAREVWGLKGE